jgi:Tfp pilus tip-associated adhesin PilY1
MTDPGSIWAVFLNGGYMPDSNSDGIDDAGTGIYVLKVKTGEKIWQAKYTSGGGELSEMKYSFPASLAPIDNIPDGFDCKFDNIVAVDRAGRLWRFDIGTTTNHTPGDQSTGSGGLIGTNPNTHRRHGMAQGSLLRLFQIHL